MATLTKRQLLDKTEELPLDIRVIGLDVTKDYWIDRGHKKFIHKIEHILYFDYNRHVNCAEITPSYECYHAMIQVHLQNDDDLSDAKRDALLRLYEDYGDDLVKYYHVHTMNGWISRYEASLAAANALQELARTYSADHAERAPLDRLVNRFRNVPYRNDGDVFGNTPAREDFDTKDEYYDAVMDALRENYNANHPF